MEFTDNDTLPPLPRASGDPMDTGDDHVISFKPALEPNEAAAGAAVAPTSASLSLVPADDGVHSVSDGTDVSLTGQTAPPTALSRFDVLADLTKPFREAFHLWFSKQGAEAILKEETYTSICQVLAARDTTHARYSQWSSKYELMDLGNGAQPYLQIRVDANKQAKPRGRNLPQKRKSEEVVSEEQSVQTGSGTSVRAEPLHHPPTVWSVKRVPRPSDYYSRWAVPCWRNLRGSTLQLLTMWACRLQLCAGLMLMIVT